MNFYFKWINKTRSKPELLPLRLQHGWYGYGLYAAVKEVLNEHNGKCNKAIIQFELNLSETDWDIIKSCQQFDVRGDTIMDHDLIQVCKEVRQTRKERSKAGKKGMKNRWNSQQELGIENTVVETQASDNHNSSVVTNVITKGITKRNNIIVTDIDTVTVREESLNQRAIALNDIRTQIENDYYEWMEERKTPAKFSVAGRKAAKEIAEYLFGVMQKRHPNEQIDSIIKECKCAWVVILGNVDSWGKFESSKLRLIDINSNLTNIINNMKHGNKSNSESNSKRNSSTANTVRSIEDIKDF